MMIIKKWVLALCVVAFCGCSHETTTHLGLYEIVAKAPSISAESIAAMDVLGTRVVDGGVNFSVYSENATRVEVLLFDDPDSERATQQFELERYGDVWNIFVSGVGYGQHYGYIAFGPNWEFDERWYPGSIHGFHSDVDANGNRFNPNKLLIDPYARALHRDHDWSKGSTGSGPRRTESTYAAASKGVVIRDTYAWSSNEEVWRKGRQSGELEGHGPGDLIIYEVHPKGFTANPSSGVAHPGTYRGVGEKAAYLQELGVTAVELMPVHEKPLDGGYWGYWTLNFFAPELSYASKQKPHEVIAEFKWMVDQLHQHGIEVILDVVYNHTGEGGLWREQIFGDDFDPDPAMTTNATQFDPKEIAGLYSFRGLDNASYYALSEDNQTYWNNTGVGNETRANYRPMRRLILDSLRFYVEELHVDGFRFDLAAILGEKDGDYNTWDEPENTVLQDILEDPIIAGYNTRIIAEPWSAGGNYGSLVGAYPTSTRSNSYAWAEWNPHFRDWWRSMMNIDEWKLKSKEGPVDGGAALTGSHDVYAWNGRKPFHSVNFVTSHDGFTMYDLFSYNEKRNGPGPLNTVCLENPMSAWCDTDSGDDHNRSRDWGSENEEFKRQLMRNMFVAMLISHGTPMLLGGDEWMRTQLGNNNAYSSGADNQWNWFRWGEWVASPQRTRMFDFVSKMIEVRKKYGHAFKPLEYGGSAPFAWKSPQNTDTPDWNGRQVMMHYYDSTLGPEILVMINMEPDDYEFTLPQGRQWYRLVDTQSFFESMEYAETRGLDSLTSGNIELDAPLEIETSYGLKGYSIVILCTKASGE